MSELEPLALLSAEAAPGLALPPELRRVYGGDLALPERCVYANFVQTIDGVVAIPSVPDSNRLVSGGSEADRFVMGLLRAAADVVLIGSGTLRASARGRWRPDTVFPAAAEAYAELRRELGLDPRPRVAILTASGSIPPDRAVLEDAPLVVTTNAGAELPGGHASRRRRGRRAAGRGRGGRPVGRRAPARARPPPHPQRGRPARLRLARRGRPRRRAVPHRVAAACGTSRLGPARARRGCRAPPRATRPARLRSARAHGSHLFLQYALSYHSRASTGSPPDAARCPNRAQSAGREGIHLPARRS